MPSSSHQLVHKLDHISRHSPLSSRTFGTSPAPYSNQTTSDEVQLYTLWQVYRESRRLFETVSKIPGSSTRPPSLCVHFRIKIAAIQLKNQQHKVNTTWVSHSPWSVVTAPSRRGLYSLTLPGPQGDNGDLKPRLMGMCARWR